MSGEKTLNHEEILTCTVASWCNINRGYECKETKLNQIPEAQGNWQWNAIWQKTATIEQVENTQLQDAGLQPDMPLFLCNVQELVPVHASKPSDISEQSGNECSTCNDDSAEVQVRERKAG